MNSRHALKAKLSHLSSVKAGKKMTMLYALILLLYVLFNIYLISHHEAVRDEAQAWTIAKSTSLSGLFSILSEEGHPALWFLFLRPFAKLGFPYAGLSFLSLFLTTSALALLLFFCDLPCFSKICISCSSLFLYYNPVIARVYSLVLLLVILLAVFWKDRLRYPLLFGVLIALLFQTHIVMAGFAGGLLLALFLDWLRKENRTGKIFAGILIGFSGAIATFLELYQFDADSTHYIDSSASSILSKISVSSLQQGLRQIVSELWPFEKGFSLICGFDSLPLYVLFLVATAVFLILCGFFFAHSRTFSEYLKLLLVLLCGVGFIVAVYSWVYTVLYQTLTCILAVLVFFFWNLYPCAHQARQRAIIALVASILFLLTVPTAVKAAVKDVDYSCSDAENISRYMENTLPEGCVVAVSNNSFVPSVCASLTSVREDIRIVNVDTGMDFTIYNWVNYPAKSAEEISRIAFSMTNAEHVYYLSPYPFEFSGEFHNCIYASPEESSTWKEDYCLFQLR